MLSAAILSTEEMIGPYLVRFEPSGCIPSRHHISFDAKCRHVKAVDDIFRSHGQLDSPVQGKMKFINFALTSGMLQLPHPLFADDINLHGIVRRARDREVDTRPPDKHYHHQNERDRRPERFKFCRTRDRLWQLDLRAPTVLDCKENHQASYEQREKNGHRDQEEIKMVHLTRHPARCFGEKGKT